MNVAALRIVEAEVAGRAGRARLARFYREAYVAQFPDRNERESLAQIADYLRRKAAGWYGPNNYHVLIALDGERPVGGAVFDYLALPRAGIVEFLFVLPAARGAGLGRRLLDAGRKLLAGDARAQGARLGALVAEINDPFRHPDAPDNMDPFARARTWGHWGFQRLLCPYAQPALSASQRPVDYLTLIVQPLARPAARSVSAAWVREVVAEYMRWAMRIDAPRAHREYRALDAWLGARARVALQPLAESLGDHPAFDVHELAPHEPEFARAAALVARAIPEPGRVASPDEFRAAWRRARAGGPAYHLWRIAAPRSRALQGVASFFALACCGFGGYLVLDPPLRGRGLLAPLVARMEAQLMADGVRTPGCFVECGDASARVLRRVGFHDLPLHWRPPTVGAAWAAPERLHLLYKPFGPVYPPLALPARFVRRALREILAGVYDLGEPARAPSYRRASASLVADAHGQVHLAARPHPPRRIARGDRVHAGDRRREAPAAPQHGDDRAPHHAGPPRGDERAGSGVPGSRVDWRGSSAPASSDPAG